MAAKSLKTPPGERPKIKYRKGYVGAQKAAGIRRQKPPKQKSGPKRTVIKASQIRALRSIMATLPECAAAIGISPRNLRERIAEDPELQKAWDEGLGQGKVSLRRLQFTHAQMPNSGGVAMTIHLSKHALGQTDKSLVEHAGKDGGPVEVFDLAKLTTEELLQYREIRRKLVPVQDQDGEGEDELAE